MKRILVMASGKGSNFNSILRAISDQRLEAEVVALVTDRERAGAAAIAEEHGVPVIVIAPSNFRTEKEWADQNVSAVKALNPDFVVLAGYLKKVDTEVVKSYKVLNTHPSLLPKYGGPGMYGDRVHKAVLEAGETETGVSLHRVTDVYDEGPVFAQKKVEVKSDDTVETLRDRVKEIENEFLVETLQKVFSGELPFPD